MRKLAIVVGALVLAVASSAAVSASSSMVLTRGGFQFVPNAFIRSDLRFTPGPIVAGSGTTVTWKHADGSGEPHTVTIVDQSDLPTSLEEVFVCPACQDALAGHDPGLDGQPPFFPVVEVGAAGLDAAGDSLLFFPGESVSAPISAPAGTTLYYLCAIHPWMQGSIKVT